MSLSKSTAFLSLTCVLVIFSGLASAYAQPEAPDRKYLFQEDKDKKEREQNQREAVRNKKKRYQSSEKSGQLPFDVSATSLNFDSTGNKLIADGGVLITYSSFILEAMKAVIDVATNEAEITGDVRISDVTGSLTADSAKLNLNTGSGHLEDVQIEFAEGGFKLDAAEAERERGEIYTLKETTLTTCECAEETNCPPWRIRANDAKIVRNGYGQVWGATVDVLNVPVFYTPYLIFPAKSERQSGLLPATFGRGRRSGFDFELPFFWAIDDSTDMTLTGIYESNVRTGLDTELRKVFSLNHRLEGGLIYLNESARDGALLGTNTTGLSDPTFSDNRFGGYLNDSWRGEAGEVPIQFLLDGRYVSDDLFVREYENDKIAKFNSRFVTSRAVLRAPISSTFTADLSSEFNQSLVSDDDFVFQRLPEAQVTGVNVFKPFGENPLGAKLVATSKAISTNFLRKESYTGSRSELQQAVKLPFHYRNYFDAAVEGSLRGSYYNLTDPTKLTPGNNGAASTTEELKKNSDRLIPSLNASANTVFERVFQASDSDFWKSFTELGTLGRNQELVRLKHTLEPGLKYRYVPDVDQEDTPIFDSQDQLPERNVVTYQLTQRLFARYEPRNSYVYGIEEATPEPEDLESLRSTVPIDQEYVFGFDDTYSGGDFQRLRSGTVRELARLKVAQSYDIEEAQQDESDNGVGDAKDPFSDVAIETLVFPNDYFAIRTKTDFDAEDAEFRSYSVESQLQDKRGDQLRTRLRFVQGNFRQLETGAEIKIIERLKLGYYSRYDDVSAELIESKVGLRLLSSCNCWVLDVNMTDRINPDETKIAFNVTLVGLGELSQRFFSSMNRTNQTSQ